MKHEYRNKPLPVFPRLIVRNELEIMLTVLNFQSFNHKCQPIYKYRQNHRFSFFLFSTTNIQKNYIAHTSIQNFKNLIFSASLFIHALAK